MNTAPMALCTLYLLLAAAMPRGAESGLTTSSIAAALSGPLSQGVQARSVSGTIENSFLNSGICEPTKAFSLDQVAREFKQFYTELGTWQGNMTCFAGTSTTPVMVDAHMWLNTTASLGRLYSCSSLNGGPAVCRTFYPRFDGSGQYCTIEATDPANYGYPLLRVGQVLNARVSIDTTWSDTDDLESHGINYYEPGNNAISGLYATYAPLDGGRPASMNCFFRLLRTCRGPLCFTETMIQ
ncbi:uncharacterized protein ACA1_214590 [Acanthamoeba castellanii str. Neff]|uniref:Uncharacterized protein n=1 Tax=Acanthamoeba castellanii (strain ATCC 30010 / Neff) TaxID=1257118 RepID=L8GPY1_ACACF|nr:uncharacterized protein ACA1_214590 [Acanthamoeba castellanii str. Neff]ELR15050.1 hypothetical protein ACA1_214590 [Acanthamoeba castellanii str. Neff]